jgi:hypothetical protein
VAGAIVSHCNEAPVDFNNRMLTLYDLCGMLYIVMLIRIVLVHVDQWMESDLEPAGLCRHMQPKWDYYRLLNIYTSPITSSLCRMPTSSKAAHLSYPMLLGPEDLMNPLPFDLKLIQIWTYALIDALCLLFGSTFKYWADIA